MIFMGLTNFVFLLLLQIHEIILIQHENLYISCIITYEFNRFECV